MARKGRAGARGGAKGGPGGFVISAIVLLIAAGAIFAFAKANNINGPEEFIDWTREASAELRECMQPEISFWTCAGPFGSGSPTDPSGEPTEPGSTEPGSTEPGVTTPAEPTKDAMLSALAALKVGDPQSVDYDRSEWKHWAGGRCDDTRQQVLREQAVSFQLDGDGCRVASGEWIDPYTGEKFTDPAKLDIDHVYSLGSAARNGGNGWDAATKEQFANDKSHLLAVSASANRSKSDSNPADWWPENSDYSCEFASSYVTVAGKYGLQFSQADVSALEKGLKTCG